MPSSGDANANILATPSAVTMDNQEAKLDVAQEYPLSPVGLDYRHHHQLRESFTTVQREEVGTILEKGNAADRSARKFARC